MTNTVPNVPRELLERCCKRMYDMMQGDLHEELRALLSAPSPAGVDGLEVVGWYTEDHLDDKSATTYSREVADRWLAKGWPVNGIANAAAAQAIIDGLRVEVERLDRESQNLSDQLGACGRDRNMFRAERDQQAQRIGELEGLLRATGEAGRQLSNAAYNLAQREGRELTKCECALLSSLRKQWDAALSAVCAAAPNIATTSEHKVPEGIVSITRSLGRAIVRFNTSEQLNEFYRAAKSALPH